MKFKTPAFWYRSAAETPFPFRLLIPLGWIYGAITAARLYLIKPQHAGVPVICIGNLTAGGSGKTPAALALMKLLKDSGLYKSPCFLTRGYGGSLTGPVAVTTKTGLVAGDEALLLSRIAPTIVSQDRLAGARHAKTLGHDLIVMDDGLQNPSLHKDISFVVVNGPLGWGNRRLVPAGPLREFIKFGLKRAHAVIAVDGAPAHEHEKPVIHAHRHLSCPLPPGSDVAAFCALGRPDNFLIGLQNLGLNVVAFRTFPDHHLYSAHDINDLRNEAGRLNAHLVTTEKDMVKIPSFEGITAIPLDLVFDDASAMLSLVKAQL